MNTRFLETFIALAELGNFRATARELHATPAAISLRIKSLEEELGVALIDRGAAKFRLTAMGESLLSHAKGVVSATEKLFDAARNTSTIRGKLRLGVIESVVHSWLSAYIQKLNADFPELELDLSVDTSIVLEKRLLAKELDLVLRVEGINHNTIVSEALVAYPIRWIAKKALISARKSDLVKRMLQHPILTFGRGTVPHRALEQIVVGLANQSGIPVTDTRITCSPSVAAIVQLVRDGYGIAAIPALFVDQYIRSGEFAELPLAMHPPAIIISMCRHANADLHVHAAANAARAACHAYSEQIGENLIEALR